ncbi:hypothetical protein [Micromonospora sp. NPDC005203]|uniref:hypothetical protein n=1 Tax=Micromonospora sp. NPDC005203 TaxID=3364226 RepID=UPI0036C77DE1
MDTSATPPPDTSPTAAPRPDGTGRRNASAAGKPSTSAAGRLGTGRHRTDSADATAAPRPTKSGPAGSEPTGSGATGSGATGSGATGSGATGSGVTASPPVTERPTDIDRPTARPTTARPTADPRSATARPTTARPTTARPTTARPTTARPTTARPTARPTTARPTADPRSATGRYSDRTPTTTRPDDTTDSAADATDTAGRGAASHRRRTVLLLLALTAVTSATALVLGLLSWAPDPPEPARPLTLAEGERLAALRVTNLRDLRAGVRVTAGVDATRIELVGWVDWSRSLLYLDVGGPGAGAERGLLQRAGSVLVIRPDPAAVPTPAAPPLVPPEDRWRLHRLTPGASLGPVLDLLLGLAADRPDADPAAAGNAARWIARDTMAGGPVDLLQAPLLTGTPAAGSTTAGSTAAGSTTAGSTAAGSTTASSTAAGSTTASSTAAGSTTASSTAAGSTTAQVRGSGSVGAEPDGQTRYWLDQDARLHKLVTRLPGVGPVTVTLHRADRPTLRPVDALGGRPGLPRALSDAEQRRLDRLPARLRAQGGAAVTLTAPTGTATNLRGAGWLSWTTRTAYLAVADLGVPGRRTLLRRDAAGLARADLPAAAGGGGTAEAPGRPPLAPPAGAWRVSRSVGDDVGRLVDAAVAAGSVGPRGAAVRIREDVTAGRTVDVVEVGPAGARLRYWVDRDGSLRRLELHTSGNAWAQLDLQPGAVPRLAPVPRPAAKPRPGTR